MSKETKEKKKKHCTGIRSSISCSVYFTGSSALSALTVRNKQPFQNDLNANKSTSRSKTAVYPKASISWTSWQKLITRSDHAKLGTIDQQFSRPLVYVQHTADELTLVEALRLTREPWYLSALDDISPEAKILGQKYARDVRQSSNEMRLGSNMVFNSLEFGPIIST